NEVGAPGQRAQGVRRPLQVSVKLSTIAVPALSGTLRASPPSQRAQTRASARARVSKGRVVHVFPHDPQAFTQGLVYLDGVLYEGTGLNGRSTIQQVAPRKEESPRA